MEWPDRKSTRLNSSHLGISYAVFCLKKKKTQTSITARPAFSPTEQRSQRARHRSRGVTALRLSTSRACCLTLSGNVFFFFFFNDTATTEIYTLSLYDALPI